MSNLKKVNSIYEDILSKVKYDSLNERYYIDMYDYVLYSLGKKQRLMLEKVCRENNIYLEALPRVMSCKETDVAFRRIKELKSKLEICSDDIKKSEYEREIRQIREKLIDRHRIVIWRIIAINFPNFKDSDYRDDIIQIGYMYLIRIIDTFDVDKCPSFSWYINNYLANNLFRDIECIDKNIFSNKDLTKLIDVRNRLISDNGDFSVVDLAMESGFDEKKVIELLTLEEIVNTDIVSVYEDEILYEDVHNELFKELLLKIVNTLSLEIQREIVIRYYGLDGRESLNTTEIAKMLGMSRQGVDYHLVQAMNSLRDLSRSKYIKELVMGYTNIELGNDYCVSTDCIINKNRYEELELFLLKQLPVSELLDLVSMVNIKCQKSLLSYLGLINNELSGDDKIKELGINVKTYLARKSKGLRTLRTIIKERYIIDGKNEDITDSMDYLMYRYLNSGKKLSRRR